MPSHNHSVSVSGSIGSGGYHTHSYREYAWGNDGSYTPGSWGGGASSYPSTGGGGSHGHTLSLSGSIGYTGSGTAFNITNPYYTLIYCVKLK